MSFYKTYNRLPNTVSVKAWSTITTTTTGTTIGGTGANTNLTADQIFKTAGKIGYISAAHDAAGLILMVAVTAGL